MLKRLFGTLCLLFVISIAAFAQAGKAEIKCQFCNKVYNFNKEELEKEAQEKIDAARRVEKLFLILKKSLPINTLPFRNGYLSKLIIFFLQPFNPLEKIYKNIIYK